MKKMKILKPELGLNFQKKNNMLAKIIEKSDNDNVPNEFTKIVEIDLMKNKSSRNSEVHHMKK